MCSILLQNVTQANNIQVASPKIDTASMDSIPGYCAVEFGLSWEHSWRLPARNNWDAAWVFCKAYTRCLGAWKHANWHEDTTIHRVLSSDNNIPLKFRVGKDGVGALVYRSQSGSGPIGAKLRMWFRFPGTALCTMKNDTVIVGVYAIEMVYIPEVAYQLGDTKNSKTLYNISKNIRVGAGQAASENISSKDGYSFNGTVLPAGYPTGYGAFYLMKHEISQHAYVDFLNSLIFREQAQRTAVSPDKVPGTYAMTTLGTPQQYRNFIRIRFSGNDDEDRPATYGHSVNESDWNREDNGGNIACNFLSWEDMLAYADWAGLRPQTELEFEKACRGIKQQIRFSEFAWGNSMANYIIRVNNLWFQNENKATEIAVKMPVATDWFDGYNALKTGEAPWVMRVGAFAKDSTGRIASGAGYYGNMNMSDNVWDRCVSVESAEGRTFTGVHGNGMLSTVLVGESDVTGWNRSYLASILRGFEISNRTATNINGRHQACGGRLALTVSAELAD
jgi:formylglycine-generating enzyme required for sulfatase activity